MTFIHDKNFCASRRCIAAAFVACMLSILGCSSPPVITHVLPENVMAHPPKVVGVITEFDSSSLIIAMQALGIPYHRIPIDSLTKFNRYSIPIVIMDEGLLQDERVQAAYQIFVDQVRRYGSMFVLLQQDPELLRKQISRYSPVVPRVVEYRLNFAMPRPTHPALTMPNLITPEDIDSLSGRTQQLARGGYGAQAIIAANLQSPDSSAGLLLQPAEPGGIWYLTFPLIQRAALGYPAEQKLLANIISYREMDAGR